MSLVTDEIKSKLNIVDLIGEYVRLQKAGASWKACCPFHNEKTPSFSISEEKQVWHCFGCGKGGDAFAFLMEIEGIEFREALENLAQRVGVKIPEYAKGESLVREDKNKIWEILDLATKFYEKQMWEGEGKKVALDYLKNRGLKEETIRGFNLGYAPKGWKNLLEFLNSRGYNLKDILKTGLLVEKNPNSGTLNSKQIQSADCYDRFRDRIIFPIKDVVGKTIGYSARVAPGGDESQAKYVNTPETEVYHKSNALYGIDKAKADIKIRDWVLLVEGNMDVIAAWQAGIKNTVAVSGTALTDEQLGIIKRYTNNIKMFFDMDDAGQKAAKRSAELAFKKGMNVFIVEIEDGKDAADAVKEDAVRFINSVEKSVVAMEYFVEKLSDKYNKKSIEGKKKIVDEVTELINSFSNKIEKEYWIRYISERLDISEKALLDTFNKAESMRKFPSDKSEELADKEMIVRDRKNNIQIQIMGMLISDSAIWKQSLEKYGESIDKYFPNKKIVEIIKEKGVAANFSFDRLLENLEDERQKKFLRELYFDNLEKSAALSSEKEREDALDKYFIELRKEINKDRVEDLIKKIKEAEISNNKEEIKKLTKELADLSKEA